MNIILIIKRETKMRRLIFSTIFILSFATLATAADDYEIKLHRPAKAGEKYHLNAMTKNTDRNIITVNGQQVDEKSSASMVVLDGVVTAVAVDERGGMTRLTVAVNSCGMGKEGEQKELLPKGTLLSASLDSNGQKLFTVDGVQVEKAISDALDNIIPLSKGEGATDDEVFGSKKRRKVGESWSIDSARAAQDLKLFKLTGGKDSVSGTTKVERVVNVRGAECLEISGTMNIKDIATDLPPGFTVEKMSANARFSGIYPVVVTERQLGGTSEMKFFLRAKGKGDPDGPEMIIESSSEQISNESVKPVK
jgi:hypothetical protein